jgi:hypothetical protein
MRRQAGSSKRIFSSEIWDGFVSSRDFHSIDSYNTIVIDKPTCGAIPAITILDCTLIY